MKYFSLLVLPLFASAAPAQDDIQALCESIHMPVELLSLILSVERELVSAPNRPPPKQDGVVIKKLRPEIDSTATREMKMWGPLKLRASNVCLIIITILQPLTNYQASRRGFGQYIKLDRNADNFSGKISRPCSDCTILKATANFAYKDGKQVDVGNGVYTHHILMLQVRFSMFKSPALLGKF
jgi:hypothetical protein